jgi:hypothetical protein
MTIKENRPQGGIPLIPLRVGWAPQIRYQKGLFQYEGNFLKKHELKIRAFPTTEQIEINNFPMTELYVL